MRLFLATLITSLFLQATAPTAHAQSSVTPLEFSSAAVRSAGWTFTPAIDYALVWDSNVLMENVGSEIVSEQVHVLKPRGTLAFNGRRGTFNLSYGGAFVQHPTFSSLNSWDQRVSASATRVLSRRTSITGHYGASAAPTTELVELVGVPFTRVGSQRQEAGAGLTTRLSRTMELSTTYRYQKVDFDEQLSDLTVLNGGYSHGGTVALKRALTQRMALTADYYLDHATFRNGSSFAVQNAWAGVDYAINADTRVFASGGASYLSAVGDRPARWGPAVQVGLARDIERASASVSYSRTFVPAYGFGGTSTNEELRGTVRVPIARRVYAQSALSYRRNEALDIAGLPLTSMWYHASVGYMLADWARIEGYTAGSRQHVDRPDGRVNRYTFGLQVTAATMTRIR